MGEPTTVERAVSRGRGKRRTEDAPNDASADGAPRGRLARILWHVRPRPLTARELALLGAVRPESLRQALDADIAGGNIEYVDARPGRSPAYYRWSAADDEHGHWIARAEEYAGWLRRIARLPLCQGLVGVRAQLGQAALDLSRHAEAFRGERKSGQ